MKLNIGCGNKLLEGYINLDLRQLEGVDIVDDATKLEKIEDNSLDELRADQTLEHFSHLETENILRLWYSKIKPGGKLHVEVPDLKLFCILWANNYIKEPWAFVSIYGGQDYEGNYHKAGFSKGYLAKLLYKVGFKNAIDLMADKPNPNCEIKIEAIK